MSQAVQDRVDEVELAPTRKHGEKFLPTFLPAPSAANSFVPELPNTLVADRAETYSPSPNLVIRDEAPDNKKPFFMVKLGHTLCGFKR